MIRTVTLDRKQKPTEEQIKQIEEAAKREIVFDEDSPELTPAMEKAFRLAVKNRNAQKELSTIPNKRRRNMNIEIVQNLYRTAKIKWSTHCLERMQERDISIDDVGNCIMSGEIIEDYPDDFPHPSCLIFGYAIHHKVLHTVVGYDGEVLHIITAYYPNTIKFMEDLKTRRKK